MGTPHKGSWMSDWAKIPACALEIMKSTNKSLLGILETDSQLLESVQVKFWSMVRGLGESGRRLEITCFFEELPLQDAGLVVSKGSAALEGYTTMSIHANHKNMVKFGSADDNGFKRLLGELTRWSKDAEPSHHVDGMGETLTVYVRETLPIRGIRTLPSVAADTLPVPVLTGDETTRRVRMKYHHIPLSKNKRFVGREAKLEELKKTFFVRNSSEIVALVGLGGIGKTQTALQFAYWVKENKPEYSVFWVPALSEESFIQTCTEIVQKFNLPKSSDDEDPKATFRQYLTSEAAGKWLLVVDNADEMEVIFGQNNASGIDEYLPASQGGLTLFTTRSQEVAAEVAGPNLISLEEMDRAEATKFLGMFLSQHMLRDENPVNILLEALVYLPLAISQAAAYLNRNDISIANYLSLLTGTEKDVTSLISREMPDNTRYRGSQNAIATTWLVSFDQIRKINARAAELLCFLSQVEPKAIPRSMLPVMDSEEQMTYAIGTLRSYAFIVKQDGQVFDMHSLVHLATRVWVKREARTNEAATAATSHFSNLFPVCGDPFDLSTLIPYLPHATKAMRGCAVTFPAARMLRLQIGLCLISQHRTVEALAHFAYVVKLQETLPAEDSVRLNALLHLGIGHVGNGQYNEGIEILEGIAAIQSRLLASADHSRLMTEYLLGISYSANCQLEKAMELLEHVVECWKTTLQTDDFRLLDAQIALARVYLSSGMVRKATDMHEHVVESRKTLPEAHNDRLTAQTALGESYIYDGQNAKAIAMLEHIVRVCEAHFEPQHISRLKAQIVLGDAYKHYGQPKRAVKLLEHVIEVQATMLAKEHHWRLTVQQSLGVAYLGTGQAERAIPLFEHVVEVEARTIAEDHPRLLASQHGLGRAYLDDDQAENAIQVLEQVVKVKTRTMAEGDFRRLESEYVLAKAYLADGRAEKAVLLLEHVVDVKARTMAKGGGSLLATQKLLQEALRRLEMHDGAG